MSFPTAFQPSAFQNDAFQIGIGTTQDSPSYEERFFTDLASANARFATLASASDVLSDGGPTTHARRFTNAATGKTHTGRGRAVPRRFDGWRRQPPR